ncbi:MAG: hypothetical protein JWN67_1880 [Actinomycetia bacterium]|nr:hypothetical protein [Actinomycetes bacterium]
MTGLAVAYISIDPVGEGVAASQVVPYVERLAALGVAVDLHSFERGEPDPAVAGRLAAAGVVWHPHPWGRYGALGGVGRIVRAGFHVRGARLVHGRGDLAAAAASWSGRRPFVWDMRAFFREQRIEQGTLRPGGPEERLLARLERRLARRADAVVVLAAAAIPVLTERHGAEVASRCHVIPTCVDLEAFRPGPAPPGPTRLAIVGTMNRLYDVPGMLAVTEALGHLRPVELVAAVPRPSAWDEAIDAAVPERTALRPDEVAGFVAGVHVGLSMLRPDLGPSTNGAMPTKIAELLASGRPVVVSPALGDMSVLVERYRCGVIADVASPGGHVRAAAELHELLGDEGLADRCRAAAEAHFDVDAAARSLVSIYAGATG